MAFEYAVNPDASGNRRFHSFTYLDVLVLTFLSVKKGLYALGFFQDIERRRVADLFRCRFCFWVKPEKYLAGQYIINYQDSYFQTYGQDLLLE